MSGNNLVLNVDISIGGTLVDSKKFDETTDTITIGSGQATLSVSADGVAPLHAVINQSDGIILLSDLGAGNISVNGNPISSNAEVKSGDTISIGSLELKLTLDGAENDTEDEDVTDPNLSLEKSASTMSAASAASVPASEFFAEEEEEEAVHEHGLNYILRLKRENKEKEPSALLEVSQLVGPEVVDTKHFAPSNNEITVGSEVAHRFRFIGKSIAWVPSSFAHFTWMMYPFTEASMEWKSDFFMPTDNKTSTPIFSWNGKNPVCLIQKDWNAFVHNYDGTTIQLADLKSQGKVTESANGYEYALEDGACIVVEANGTSFIGSRVPQGKKITGGATADLDYPFMAVLSVLTILFSFLTYYIIFQAKRPEIDTSEAEERMAELLLEEAPEPPPEENKPDSNPDAGEGAKAKKEEGKVGKKDAKMKQAKGDKVEISKKQKDKEVVDEFMSGLNFGANSESGALDGMGGIASLDADMQGGLGGVIGAKGVQAGSGGLGSRGSGLGGGGTADGIGGLGTKGSGRGSSGYGKGGGSVGKKRTGGSIKSGGNPIILGALDKSLIDAVIKRNMSQIRYCYQRELTKNPSLKGKIIVKFVIAANGSVSKASIKSSSMGSAAVESCITGRFRRFKFPEPKGGGIVIVSYPFIFAS